MDPYVGLAQGVPEHEQVVFQVCAPTFPAYVLNWIFPLRSAEQMTFWAILPEVL